MAVNEARVGRAEALKSVLDAFENSTTTPEVMLPSSVRAELAASARAREQVAKAQVDVRKPKEHASYK
jgi:hypothetical protein